MNKWIDYYLDHGDISPECARTWERAQEAYSQALFLRDPTLYIEMRKRAMKYHAPTGDCQSDRIEGVYFPNYMDDSQFQSLAERSPGSDWPTMDKINQLIRWGRLVR